MENTKKRVASAVLDADREGKKKKSWKPHHPTSNIEAGDTGIFATCERGREAKCVNELKNLLEEYSDKLYGQLNESENVDEDDDLDVEAGIAAELTDMKKLKRAPAFANVNIDVKCVVFIKTKPPLEPVKLVQAICEDVYSTGKRKTRFTQRLSPIEVTANASDEGFEQAAEIVLAPHFFGDNESKKFAIRANVRASTKWSRSKVIDKIGRLVGPLHKVDLTNYDLLILVEVYKSTCGISVIGKEFERLKRFNLEQIGPATKTEASEAAQTDDAVERSQRSKTDDAIGTVKTADFGKAAELGEHTDSTLVGSETGS